MFRASELDSFRALGGAELSDRMPVRPVGSFGAVMVSTGVVVKLGVTISTVTCTLGHSAFTIPPPKTICSSVPADWPLPLHAADTASPVCFRDDMQRSEHGVSLEKSASEQFGMASL